MCGIFQSTDGCVVVFLQILHWNCVWDLFLSSLANFTLGASSIRCIFWNRFWKLRSLNLIGSIFVGAMCLLSTGRLWPASSPATNDNQKSRLFSNHIVQNIGVDNVIYCLTLPDCVLCLCVHASLPVCVYVHTHTHTYTYNMHTLANSYNILPHFAWLYVVSICTCFSSCLVYLHTNIHIHLQYAYTSKQLQYIASFCLTVCCVYMYMLLFLSCVCVCVH